MRTKDLTPNPKNPRTVTEAKLEQLKKALLEFGDLSGIVYNCTTKQLVGGHQRLKSFDADAPITITRKFKKATCTGTVAEGYVELRGERFSYREVAWSKHREMAANLAANKGAGEWDLPQVADWLKELGSFDVDFDMDLTMFEQPERHVVSEHLRANPNSFEPGDEDDQGQLDEKQSVFLICPACSRAAEESKFRVAGT